MENNVKNQNQEQQRAEELAILRNKKKLYIDAINSVTYGPKRELWINKIAEIEDTILELEYGTTDFNELKKLAKNG